ncbi:MAG: LysM peptidoglycan-binding domain-containing protein, partial [Lentisphaeria bacterium]|nr:LysM peptidoglycan-binding domain-containing protein [Lentisphaeria bacterium]
AAPAAAAADALNDDLSDTPGVKEDKVVNTPDGKMKLVPAQDTTLEQIAAKYQITVDLLRKDNPGLPASGTIKAGTEILIGK